MRNRSFVKVLLGIAGVGLITAGVLLFPFDLAKASPPDATKETTVADSLHYSAEDSLSVIADSSDSIPVGARILMEVYPDHVKAYNEGELLMADGTTITYDDKREKSFVQKLDDADPEDMFAFKYDRTSWTPGFLQDAGRSRCEALFKKMYGSSAAQVRKHLVTVSWFGEKVQFTTVNHADDSLRAVATEMAKHPELKRYLKSSGTFLWRKVRGANRQSAHSYGMTIDVGVKYSDYWLWKNPGKKETDKITYANRMPHLLVEIFERHGFIWGGRWYHYDTMHFEFRPEILRYQSLSE